MERNLQETIIRHRRVIHENAECGFNVPRTQEYITEELKKLGLSPYTVGRGGVAALIRGRQDGKCVMLRADIDALPIKEETKLTFSSKTGAMHACGHDMHTAMLLGAAELLVKGGISRGAVKLYFQPAEELLLGAVDGIASGILKEPTVDCAISIHVLTGIPIKAGTVIIPKEGYGAPASRFFTVNVTGKGCHGATPQNGVDAVNCLAYLLCEYNSLLAKEIKHLGIELTVGLISGGAAANAIADEAKIEGSLRAPTKEALRYAMTRLETVTKCIAKAHRAEAEIKYGGYAPPLINNREIVEAISAMLLSELGEAHVLKAESLPTDTASSIGGSEDFASFAEEVPSCLLGIAAGEPELGYVHTLHHPSVDFDEQALTTGARALLIAARALLNEGECI